ncbi:DUF4189 domain-containing protein [Nocardia arthritidis]|nr:DUF4189 domain-containing protein [Nocardia arthritidis]
MSYPPQDPNDPRYQSGPHYQPGPYQPPPNPPYGYGPGQPPPGSGGGRTALIIVAAVVGVLIVGTAVTLGVLLATRHDSTDAQGTDTASATTASSARPTTSYSLPPLPTTTVPAPPPPTTQSTFWIAATYNPATNKIAWARSSVSSDDATARALSQCGDCQNPTWAREGCVAVVFGQNNGWAANWGPTAAEAENNAIGTAQKTYGVSGPFNRWSKCARE